MISVYVAGSISNPDALKVFSNVGKGIKVAAELLKAGVVPFCPFLDIPFNYFVELSEDEIMTYDLYWLKKCDVVLVISDDWKASKGTCKEVEYANQLGKYIYFSVKELLGDIHKGVDNG